MNEAEMIVVPMPTWVRFTGYGGYDIERERALQELKVGEEYVILNLNVGRSSSTVDIADFHGRPLGSYNTAMFDFLAWGMEGDEELEAA